VTKAGAPAAFLAAAVLAAGCGDDSDDGEPSPPPPDKSPVEAAPEAPPATTPQAGEPGELTPSDEEAVSAAVRAYIRALDSGDGEAVCAAFEPGAVKLEELPSQSAGCGPSLDASIGVKPKGGAPAWRRTKIAELNAVSVAADTARVTATVTHDFSDRSYNSIEEDVIYLRRSGDRWLIAKPSGTFYRAVGYPEPPLRALTPP
jgi:hypothetical protein